MRPGVGQAWYDCTRCERKSVAQQGNTMHYSFILVFVTFYSSCIYTLTCNIIRVQPTAQMARIMPMFLYCEM